jgi:serine/threonine protein kinase
MVNSAGVVKLVDFGIARTYKEDKLQDTIALGSENYAAPEQWGQAQTDPRSDIYGLGATIYHLLGNLPPSPAFLPSEPASLDTLNSALSAEVVSVVEKAMMRDRENRYSSAQDFKQALVACWPDHASPVQTQITPVSKRSSVPAKGQNVTKASTPKGQSLPKLQRQVDRSGVPSPSLSSPSGSTTKTRPPVRRIVRVRICPNCKHKNKASSRFCVRCGYAFVGIRPAVLRVIEPVRAAWEMPVSKSPLMLGRASPAVGYRPDFDMTFYDPDGYVSRRHAHIIKAKNGYFIADLGSSNGTYVNDQSLSPKKFKRLRNGDKIEIGEVAIHFLLR